MRARKRLAFGLRTYSNLEARRARSRIDIRVFDAVIAGEGEYYTVSPRIKKLVKETDDAIDAAIEREATLTMIAWEESVFEDEQQAAWIHAMTDSIPSQCVGCDAVGSMCVSCGKCFVHCHCERPF